MDTDSSQVGDTAALDAQQQDFPHEAPALAADMQPCDSARHKHEAWQIARVLLHVRDFSFSLHIRCLDCEPCRCKIASEQMMCTMYDHMHPHAYSHSRYAIQHRCQKESQLQQERNSEQGIVIVSECTGTISQGNIAWDASVSE